MSALEVEAVRAFVMIADLQSFTRAAVALGSTQGAVSVKLKRLEERGVIRAFTIEVDPAALGYTLQAIVRIRPLPGKLHMVQDLIQQIAQFSECDKVTGDDCFVARLHIRSIDELDKILDRIADKAETSSSIVKAQPVKRRLPPLL